MEHCKFCQAELPEGSTVCPSCGKDNAEPEKTLTQEPAAEVTGQKAAEHETAPEETIEPREQAGEEQPGTPETSDEVPQTGGEEKEEKPLSAPIQDGLKATPGKMALMIAGVVVLVGIMVALILAGTRKDQNTQTASKPTEPEEAAQAEMETQPVETTPATIPADGDPNDVTCKGSYSVSDEEAEQSRDVVIATWSDKQLTNAQLRVYYWMEVQSFLSNYGSYASYFGLDYTKPLDTQLSMEDNGLTWQKYFLQAALTNWQQVQALAVAGEQGGMEISPENQAVLDGLEDTVAQMAESYNVTTEELLKSNFGPGVGMEEYKNFQTLYYQGLPYYTAETAKLVPKDEVLREFFETHREDYASGGVNEEDQYVDVRHILIMPEGGTTGEDGTTTYSDEEWEACREKAQAVLDEYLAGEKTEEAFGALAAEKTQDPGSQSTGGLYQQVYPGQMVTEFNDWCFDENRKPGDTDLVKTSYGYHVMYFVSSQPQWEYFATRDWTQEQTNQLIENLVNAHPLEIDYEKIALGVVDMSN